ncbi:hypothetical protein P3T36_004618 [Kitasatospora sp. MAP12-15]|uniref:DUF4244 domain-containing protein n=1 Tax=unclassified Kitasatospora TaxID=2633591 RepID=UPI002475FBC2|nr:DUF4244 domain-containing protein [Kitasatospora sp. MAP12-44]MDH6111464.1 hypothetical protein [Kitasatospora sp. MAP12-44]
MNGIFGDAVPCITFVPYPPHNRVAEITRLEEPSREEPTLVLVACPADTTCGTAKQGGRHGPGRPSRLRRSLRRRMRWLGARVCGKAAAGGDSGMSTAEYAVGTVAACGFAALLYKVVTGGGITDALTELVNRALHAV